MLPLCKFLLFWCFLGGTRRLNSWIALHQVQWQLDGSRERELYAKVQIFCLFFRLSKIYPVILTLDGHYSHSRNIEVKDCARKNGVNIVCLPPHSIHKLQLLGVPFFQPLKAYHAQELEI